MMMTTMMARQISPPMETVFELTLVFFAAVVLVAPPAAAAVLPPTAEVSESRPAVRPPAKSPAWDLGRTEFFSMALHLPSSRPGQFAAEGKPGFRWARGAVGGSQARGGGLAASAPRPLG